jgi:2-methylisocitrate lyase-like PEP mutase family enzyme
MTFLEAPESIEQMKEYCKRVSGPKLANMLEYGNTPILPPTELKRMGYTMAAYPLTLLSASIKAMQESLDRIKNGLPTDDLILVRNDHELNCVWYSIFTLISAMCTGVFGDERSCWF